MVVIGRIEAKKLFNWTIEPLVAFIFAGKINPNNKEWSLFPKNKLFPRELLYRLVITLKFYLNVPQNLVFG